MTTTSKKKWTRPDPQPKGAEMKVLKKLEQIARGKGFEHSAFTTECDQHSGSSFSISVGHALERVRCNGWERLQTTPMALENLRVKVRSALHDAREAARYAEWLANEASEVLIFFGLNLRPCPDCDGKGGPERGPCPASLYHRSQYEKCTTCDGLGVLKHYRTGAQSHDRWNR